MLPHNPGIHPICSYVSLMSRPRRSSPLSIRFLLLLLLLLWSFIPHPLPPFTFVYASPSPLSRFPFIRHPLPSFRLVNSFPFLSAYPISVAPILTLTIVFSSEPQQTLPPTSSLPFPSLPTPPLPYQHPPRNKPISIRQTLSWLFLNLDREPNAKKNASFSAYSLHLVHTKTN